MTQSIRLALLIVLATITTSRADEDSETWVKFFVGDWTRQRETWTEKNGTKQETATWSCELAAGGRATVSKGTWNESGLQWVLLSGSSPRQFHFEHGAGSDGGAWSVAYDKVDANTIKGKATAVLDGEPLSGAVTITRTSDNSYTATVEATNAEGKLVWKSTAKNSRVSKDADPQLVQAWRKYLEGEWTYQISPLDIEGTVTWSLNAKGNASVGRFVDSTGRTSIEISGWRSDTKAMVVNGYGSEGNSWLLELNKITADTIEGPNLGVLPDGRSYDGVFTGKQVDKNHYEWRFQGKTGDGEPLSMTGKYTRKTTR